MKLCNDATLLQLKFFFTILKKRNDYLKPSFTNYKHVAIMISSYRAAVFRFVATIVIQNPNKFLALIK